MPGLGKTSKTTPIRFRISNDCAAVVERIASEAQVTPYVIQQRIFQKGFAAEMRERQQNLSVAPKVA